MSVAMHAVRAPYQTTGRCQYRPAARLRHEGVSDADRNYALAMHLTPFAFFAFAPLVLAPLVLWLIRKDQSAYVDDHGREVVNMLITGLILTLLNFTLIAIPFSIAWTIVISINMIRGAVAASNGEYFRYPMVIRFLS